MKRLSRQEEFDLSMLKQETDILASHIKNCDINTEEKPMYLKAKIKEALDKQDKFTHLNTLTQIFDKAQSRFAVKHYSFKQAPLSSFYNLDTLTTEDASELKEKLADAYDVIKEHIADIKAKLLPIAIIKGNTEQSARFAIQKLFYATKTYTKKDEQTAKHYVNMHMEDLAECSYVAIKKAVDKLCSSGNGEFPPLSELNQLIVGYNDEALKLLANINFTEKFFDKVSGNI